MKNRIVLIIAVCFTYMACHDELDQEPITEKSASNFFSTADELESAIIGVYANLQNNALYGLDMIAAGEIAGDHTFDEQPSNDGGRFGEIDEFFILPSNDLVGDVWRVSYKAILGCNIVLNRIDRIDFENESDRTRLTGEAKFLRALMYFNLVRLYGDVPLVANESEDVNDFFGQGRTSLEQVYDQIVDDLIESQDGLPANSANGRVTLGAAQALLGKVYLTLGNFDAAEAQLEAVVSSGDYALESSLDAIFGEDNEGNSETIFAVQFTSGLNNQSEGSPSFTQFSPEASGLPNAKGHNIPTRSFYDSYDPNDLRVGVYVDTIATGVAFANKFGTTSVNPDDGGADFILLRYSDVVLMYAEALNENSKTSLALNQLNSIRTRAGLPNSAASTQEEIRDAIADERCFELIGEGHRWFDLLRTDQALLTLGIDSTFLLFPIPQSQIDTDPAITQNPGY